MKMCQPKKIVYFEHFQFLNCLLSLVSKSLKSIKRAQNQRNALFLAFNFYQLRILMWSWFFFCMTMTASIKSWNLRLFRSVLDYQSQNQKIWCLEQIWLSFKIMSLWCNMLWKDRSSWNFQGQLRPCHWILKFISYSINRQSRHFNNGINAFLLLYIFSYYPVGAEKHLQSTNSFE